MINGFGRFSLCLDSTLRFTDYKDFLQAAKAIRRPERCVFFDSLVSFIAGLPYCEGYCYTQLSDVEQEVNGLLTHDHHFKVNPAKLKAIQDKTASTRE